MISAVGVATPLEQQAAGELIIRREAKQQVGANPAIGMECEYFRVSQSADRSIGRRPVSSRPAGGAEGQQVANWRPARLPFLLAASAPHLIAQLFPRRPSEKYQSIRLRRGQQVACGRPTKPEVIGRPAGGAHPLGIIGRGNPFPASDRSFGPLAERRSTSGRWSAL